MFIIATIAGTGSSSYSGDNGAAAAADINGPHGLDVDTTGNGYISVLIWASLTIFILLR